MSHDNEIFSDIFASNNNTISRIDARTKIIFTGVALIINLLSINVFTPLASLLFCLTALTIAHVPARLVIIRLTIPIMMAAVVLVTQVLINGSTPLFVISLGGFGLSGYQEGLANGTLIMARVISGAGLVLFLSMTTPTNKIMAAAAWFKAPKILVEIMLLMYRYIFVLIEEVDTMRQAQKIRLGYSTWRRSMSSLSVLGASLVIRAYDRADRVFQAMLARGYGESRKIGYPERFRRTDFLSGAALSSILFVFFLTGRLFL